MAVLCKNKSYSIDGFGCVGLYLIEVLVFGMPNFVEVCYDYCSNVYTHVCGMLFFF